MKLRMQQLTETNKKVLLRERKRHTARRVANIGYAVPVGGTPIPGQDRGDTPIPGQDGGTPWGRMGVPPCREGWGWGPDGVPCPPPPPPPPPPVEV